MDKKILIYEDSGQKQTFRLACETTAAQANDLITVFQAYQDLKEIETIDEFYALVTDPILFYDETLRTGLSLQAAGNRTPDPETLAKLFSYDRPNYKKSIQGMPVTSTDCEGCKTKKIVRKPKAAITSARFNAYRSYLTFTPDGFILNDEAITEYCKKFDYYAETPQQLETAELFTQLVDVLNRFDALSPLPQKDKEALTRMFKIGIERPPHDGRFLIDQLSLRDEVFKY